VLKEKQEKEVEREENMGKERKGERKPSFFSKFLSQKEKF
jgi:hypothetical protein